MQEVTQLCPVQHPRAVRFLRRWACERLATLADEILVSRAAAALERWRRAAAAMAMAERKEAYLRYQGSSKLMFSLDKAYLRRLAKGWIQWGAFMEAERARERRALEQSAAITIQQAVRGFHARRLRAWLRIVAQDRQRHLAAVTLTRYAKGKVARMRYARVRAGIERLRAGELLRRVGRGMLGRMKAKRLREERARLKAREKEERRSDATSSFDFLSYRSQSLLLVRQMYRPYILPVSSIHPPIRVPYAASVLISGVSFSSTPLSHTQLFSTSINHGRIFTLCPTYSSEHVLRRSSLVTHTRRNLARKHLGSSQSAEALPRSGWAASLLDHHQGQTGAAGSDENTGDHAWEVGQATRRKVQKGGRLGQRKHVDVAVIALP